MTVKRANVYILSANRTITKAQRDVWMLARAVDLVVSLPESDGGSAGNRVRVVVDTVSAVTGFAFKPVTGQFIRGTGITAAAGKKLVNAAATNARGDVCELVSTGDGSWWLTNKIGTWVREA